MSDYPLSRAAWHDASATLTKYCIIRIPEVIIIKISMLV